MYVFVKFLKNKSPAADDLPDLPSYYDVLNDPNVLNMKNESFKQKMSHAYQPLTSSMYKFSNKTFEAKALKLSKMILEYGGDVTGKMPSGNLEQANQILQLGINRDGNVYAGDEVILQLIRQLTNCPEELKKNYIQLMIIIATYLVFYNKEVKQFIREYVKTQLCNPTMSQFRSEFKYIQHGILAPNALCTYDDEQASTNWALKHVQGPSFFHKSLPEQMEHQAKANYDNFTIPWLIVQICHAVRSTVKLAAMNAIIR